MNSTALASTIELPAVITARLIERKAVHAPNVQSPRIPVLDGLRGTAIFLVLVRHSIAGTPTTSPIWAAVLSPLRLSWSGVDLFFVLSGFLIGGILLDAKHSKNYFETFYIRRAFRILPIYGVVLILYFSRHLPIRWLPELLGQTSALPIPWFSFFTFTQNFWMAAFGWYGPLAIAPTWSLAVEEQFYLTIPFLVRKLRQKVLYLALFCAIIGAPLLRSILPHLIPHGYFGDYILMPCRADALSLGVLAALLYRRPKFRTEIRECAWVVYLVIATTVGGIIFLTYWAPEQFGTAMVTWGFSCLAVFYVSILIAAVGGLSTKVERFLSCSALRRLGTLAYCTYLIHESLIVAARRLVQIHSRLSPPQSWAIGGLIGVITALAMAAISWNLFEKPLLRYGHQFKYSFINPPAVDPGNQGRPF